MPMDRQTDIAFTEYLRETADRTSREIKYNPGNFRQMIANEGGYQTALKLLKPNRSVSDGFTELLLANRLDLSVEAIALQPRWSRYFTEEYLNEARRRLRAVNFDLTQIPNPAEDLANAEVVDWTVEEVRAIVDDYFRMLLDEAIGNSYNKSRHNDELRGHLNNRTKASVEFKHQNISAVLNEIDMPYIRGYKPASNYQKLLSDEVQHYLEANREVIDRIVGAYETVPTVTVVAAQIGGYFEDPPEPRGRTEDIREPTFEPRKRVAAELAKKDFANKKLGDAGEKFVFEIEGARLRSSGKPELAEKVSWISRDKGDGAGYDILSYESDGTVRYIEVKTTNGGAKTPFLMSRNEFEFSRRNPKTFHIYRVYGFRNEPKIYVLTFPIDDSALIEPASYRVSF